MKMKEVLIFSISCLMITGTTYGQGKLKSHPIAIDKHVQAAVTPDKHAASTTTANPSTIRPALTNTQRMLNDYRFNEVIPLLQKEIKTKQARKQYVESEKQDLKSAEMGEKMLTATQKIVFIDSIVTTYDNFMSKIQLSKEAGTIKPFNDFFQSNKQPDAYLYLNELGTKCYFSMEDSMENMCLYTSDKLDGKWSEPSEINISGNKADQINYPYMMSDGTTLYFAATGGESLGGYDIFVTRYDSESGSFLKAENIGMPFNSPANDYMYAEDEMDNIGWFVTDRNQPVGKVCIYMFIPSDTRQVYEAGKYNREQIRRLAMISKIADTWGDGQEREQALTRLAKSINTQKKSKSSAFNFVINDNTTYTSLADFKKPEAKQKMAELLSKQKNLKDITSLLESLRSNYTKSQESQKEELKSSILQNEQQIFRLQMEIKEIEKSIRNTELSSINQ